MTQQLKQREAYLYPLPTPWSVFMSSNTYAAYYFYLLFSSVTHIYGSRTIIKSYLLACIDRLCADGLLIKEDSIKPKSSSLFAT